MSDKAIRNAVRNARHVIKKPKADVDKYQKRYMRHIERSGMAAGGVPDPQPNELGLYSQGAYAAANLPQAKGTPQQFRSMLDKQGVKPDEFLHTGWDEAFANRPSVTREEVAEHFSKNAPQISERVLGRIGNVESRLNELEGARQDRRLTGAEEDEYRRIINLLNDDNAPTTKYDKYTLPGGENYRELLLRTPPARNAADEYQQTVQGLQRQIMQLEDNNPNWTPELEGQRRTLFAQLDDANRNYQSAGKPEPSPQYRSSHWDDPNVLAHIRMSDRRGPNGEKILHIEEIQSDWAQEGRKRGFNNDNAARIVDLRRQARELIAGRMPNQMSIEEITRVREIGDEALALGANQQGIPMAPYVDSTDKWVDLSLKRIFNEAAKGGYDGIAFTPGSEQAKRYNLSQQVSKIQYFPTTGSLKAFDTDGDLLMDKRDLRPEELSKHIGKEVAAKLLSDEFAIPNKFSEGVLLHEMRGQNLSVGGEGMKSFYDRMVPKQAEKLAKKFDKGSKVNLHHLPIHGNSAPAHYLPVTDDMREKILKGMPTFADGGEVEDAKGLVQMGGVSASRESRLANWYKDSKVRDKENKPLVVYHHGDFSESDHKVPDVGSHGMHFGTKQAATERAYGKPVDDFIKSVQYDQDSGGKWHWFANDGTGSAEFQDEGFQSKDHAKRHAENFAQEQYSDIDQSPEEMGNMTAAYLNIKNPKRVADQGHDWSDSVAQAKQEGYDGIVYRNKYEDKGSDSYVVFHPSQVKSINAESFDPSDPDITKADGGEVDGLDIDKYPTHYLPEVGRQVMADGGTMEGAVPPSPTHPDSPLVPVIHSHLENYDYGEPPTVDEHKDLNSKWRGYVENVKSSSRGVPESNGYLIDAYHGTTSNKDFDQFKHSRDDIGVHFGDKHQANERLEYLSDYEGKNRGSRIIPVKLKIENPIFMPDRGAFMPGANREMAEELSGIVEGFNEHFPSISEGKYPSYSQMRKFLKEKGHDGIIYKNSFEGRGGNLSYVIFDPSQAKSAISNSEFNPSDPNIHRAAGGSVKGAFKPDGSLKSEKGYVYHGTNVERASQIAQEGMKLFDPSDFTEQDSWPDGSTNPRAYFSRNAGYVHSFLPEEGEGVVLRAKEPDHAKTERYTNDVYVEKPIPPHEFEILNQSGEWEHLPSFFEGKAAGGSVVDLPEADAPPSPLSSTPTTSPSPPMLFFKPSKKEKIKTNEPTRPRSENSSVKKALMLTSSTLHGRAGRGTPR